MRNKPLYYWLALLILPAAAGCGVIKELCRYTTEQVEYYELTDECLSTARSRQLARETWEEYQQSNPGCEYSDDYAAGFEAGFVDYIDSGPGAPPVVPPRRYWRVCYQTPLGQRRGEEWLEGFRAGAIAAEESGYRSNVTVPVALHPDCTMEPDIRR